VLKVLGKKKKIMRKENRRRKNKKKKRERKKKKKEKKKKIKKKKIMRKLKPQGSENTFLVAYIPFQDENKSHCSSQSVDTSLKQQRMLLRHIHMTHICHRECQSHTIN
jgi:hypothetical protein